MQAAIVSRRREDRRRQRDQAGRVPRRAHSRRRARAPPARPRGARRDGGRRGERVPRRRLRRRRRADRVASTRSGPRPSSLLKVKEPIAAEYGRLREGLVLFTYLHLAADEPLTRALVESGIAARRLRDGRDATTGALPLLAPMSEVAGRLAAQAGAYFLEKPLGRPRDPARRRPGRRARRGRRDRRRHRRLQRGASSRSASAPT